MILPTGYRITVKSRKMSDSNINSLDTNMSKLLLAFGLAMVVLSMGCRNSKPDTSNQKSKVVKTTQLHFAGFAKSKSGAT